MLNTSKIAELRIIWDALFEAECAASDEFREAHWDFARLCMKLYRPISIEEVHARGLGEDIVFMLGQECYCKGIYRKKYAAPFFVHNLLERIQEARTALSEFEQKCEVLRKALIEYRDRIIALRAQENTSSD